MLRTLGTIGLERDGHPVAGSASQRKPLAILAVLAASGPKGIPRERIESLFWPDTESERAKRTLNQYLYQLRRELGEPELILGSGILSLNESVIETDLARFLKAIVDRRFCDATDCYGGSFLDGVSFPRLDELERFLSSTRDSIESKYKTALEALAETATRGGRNSEAVRWLERLASQDPYSSKIAVRYMIALEKAGEREKAIRHADLFERMVKADLDATVSNEVLELAARLRSDSSGATAQASSTVRPEATLSEANDVRAQPALTDMRPHGSRVRGVVAMALVLVAVAFGLSVKGFAARRPEKLSPLRESFVVVPFENETGDKALDGLGSMGAEWITDGLSRINTVPVIDPRTAAEAITALKRARGNSAYSVSDIGKSTGAENVITGGFFKRGDTLEFNGRIVNSRTGNVLGAIQPVVVPVSDASKGIGLLRTRMLGLLAQMYDARIAQLTVRDATPPNLEAYSEFVAGIDRFASDALPSQTDTGVAIGQSAREHFRRAYEKDTTFVTALVWVLHTYVADEGLNAARPLLDSVKVRRSRMTPLERYAVDYFVASAAGDAQAVLRAAEAASDIAPRSEWSWIAGQILFPLNRPQETLKYFSRLDPDRGWMRGGWEYYWYLRAQTSHMLNDLAGTHLWLTRARQKFPESVPIAAAYARSLALNNQADSAVIIAQQILQSSIDWRAFYVYSIIEDLRRHRRYAEQHAVYDALLTWYKTLGSSAREADRREVGHAMLAMGQDSSAERIFKALVADFPKSGWRTTNRGQLAVLLARRGDSAAATHLMQSVSKAEEQWPGENTLWWARIAAELEEREKAVKLLRSAFDQGIPQVSLSHSMWYAFPKLQGYPLFEALFGSNR